MITDKAFTFCEEDATGDTGTRIVGDVVNTLHLRDQGAGQPVYLRVFVTTTIEAGTGGTYQIALTSGTNASLASPVNHVLSAVFDAGSDIVAGTELLNVALPMEGIEYKQFLGIREIVGVENTTAGAITAVVTIDPLSYKAYPQGTVEV